MIKSRLPFLRSVLFVLILIVYAEDNFGADDQPSLLFNKANSAYVEKNYTTAIDLYREILKNGYESTELYYNLGNSYYRIGRIGYAVLYYEKALKLSPKDEDISHNLALANLRTVDRIDTLPEFFLFRWWEGLLNFFTVTQWLQAALILYFVLLILSGYYFFADSASGQKAAVSGAAFSLIMLVLAVSLFIVKFNRENEQKAVVVTNSAAVKLAPENTAEEAFIVHEGLKIKVEDKVNEWYKIRLIDGKLGWVRSGEIEII